jgi:hypothetical protein
MNSRFPRLPALRGLAARTAAVSAGMAGLAAMALVPCAAFGQPGPAGSVYRRAETPAPAALAPTQTAAAEQGGGTPAEQGTTAERIVATALSSLARAESISARVRQLARVGDTVLKGGGRYLQSGVGEEQRFRFESRLNSETEEFEMLEVCDALFFWTYRKMGPNPAQVERVDIRRVQERLEKLNVADRTATAAYLGGIQRSLALIREWFRFSSAASAAIDGLPVWVIEGDWNRESLAAILPAQAEAIRSAAGISAAELPEGMPWSVRLSIGKRELFPFRIEWLAIPGKRPVAASAPEVVAVLELYEVRIGDPVDATAFVYKPATEGLIDTSDAFSNGLSPLRP